jgi:hypothetical protein
MKIFESLLIILHKEQWVCKISNKDDFKKIEKISPIKVTIL